MFERPLRSLTAAVLVGALGTLTVACSDGRTEHTELVDTLMSEPCPPAAAIEERFGGEEEVVVERNTGWRRSMKPRTVCWYRWLPDHRFKPPRCLMERPRRLTPGSSLHRAALLREAQDSDASETSYKARHEDTLGACDDEGRLHGEVLAMDVAPEEELRGPIPATCPPMQTLAPGLRHRIGPLVGSDVYPARKVCIYETRRPECARNLLGRAGGYCARDRPVEDVAE